MYKILLLSLSIMLWSCGKSSEHKTEAGQQSGQTELTAQPAMVSPEIKRIDEQAALINLLVSNNDELCQTEIKIDGLSSLATTEESKRYAKKKQEELTNLIAPKIKQILENHWKDFSHRTMEEEIPVAVKISFKNSKNSYSFLSTNFLKEETKYEKKGRVKACTREYLVMTREHTGLFSSDNFYTMNVLCKASTSTLCSDTDDITYRADVTKVTKTAKPQSNGEWK